MSGVYILSTKDGYRVSFSTRYEDIVVFDKDIIYKVDGKIAKLVFGRCYCHEHEEDAIEHAREIAKLHPELDDGICFIRYAETKTFKELTRG